MGVLGPLDRNADELGDLKDYYLPKVEKSKENLDKFAGAILNGREDVLWEKEPFLFLMGDPDVEELMAIDSMDEINRHKQRLDKFKRDFLISSAKARYVKAFTDDFDVDIDFDNPIETYADLDELQRELDGLDVRIEDRVADKLGLDDHFIYEMDLEQYNYLRKFYSRADNFKTMPVREAISESRRNIEEGKRELLDYALWEYHDFSESRDEYDRVDLPFQPVDWSEVIEEDSIQEYLDISEIATATYGDTLHMMMEQVVEGLEGVEAEYPLHFRKTGKRDDTNRHDRIDNTFRPDAIDDLFIYEFKHMPEEQRRFWDQNGRMKRDKKFHENVRQVNKYLNELDLPAGMLVYITSDMEVREKVVERHDRTVRNYDRFVHDREDYSFEDIGKML